MRRIVLLGGGGHAASVIDAMRAAGLSPSLILDSNRLLWGTEVLSVPIAGGDESLCALDGTDFVVTLGAIGAGHSRRRLFEIAVSSGLRPMTIIHPAAIISANAKVGQGSVILAGAVVGVRAVVGRNVIVNTRAVVEHDCHVADHSHISTGACLSGQVAIEELAFVGAGAAIRQGTRIGVGAVVGLGAVVVSDVPPDVTVTGNPAVVWGSRS